ncbi:hypothetical protein [Microbacterium sp. H83]|uniref:hypothetical protein n=1 Tax=Microbacterium sp. H83 TaxID=1827324 RepID=UPI0007F424C5|nr:hypothetical protein [Microbacterium sp. H83]OAN40992.1 hypothetical protein A4X16_02345 [Microbacterium sp. H83]
MDIILSNMSLATQVLEHQEGHAQAVREHLAQYARLTNGDLGLILQLLQPLNEAVVDAGDKVAEFSGKAFGAGAEKMTQTREIYLEADRAAYEAASAVAGTLGATMPGYIAPSAPTLGGAQQSAPSRYDDADGNVFNQAFWDGYSMAEWADGTGDQAGRRVADGLSSSRSVSEIVDVRSYLPAPHAEDPEIESIRWKAGVIFGSVDWLFEQLAGFSLLEEATKPFAGNWVRMREASFAWTHTGDALRGLGQNAMGLLPPMASWTGKGSEAFLAAAGVVSQAHTVAAGPAGTVSSALKAIVMLSKEIAGLILKVLKNLERKLMRMAAEAAVPLVGWAAAAVEAGFAVYDLINYAMKIYKWLNRIYDLVSGMASSVADMADNYFRMADLYEGLVRGATARV